MSQKAIRAALTANPDGLTARQLCEVAGKDIDNTYRQLKVTYGVYIDRWVDAPPRSPVPHVAVYVLAPVPEDCPMPEKTAKRAL